MGSDGSRRVDNDLRRRRLHLFQSLCGSETARGARGGRGGGANVINPDLFGRVCLQMLTLVLCSFATAPLAFSVLASTEVKASRAASSAATPSLPSCILSSIDVFTLASSARPVRR